MRFLIVDDNVEQVESLIKLLRFLGHEALGATNARAAEQLVAVHPPEVVLLDLILPGGSGVGFLGWLRGQERFRETPVLVTTALPEECMPDLTADNHLALCRKPFDCEEMLEKVNELLGQPPPALPAQPAGGA